MICTLSIYLSPMKDISHKSSIKVYDDYHELADDQIVMLCKRSIDAMQDAYAPYSKFQVGAALLLDDGTFVQGNNQENAVYPLGLCAERVTLYAASSQYPDRSITHLAVTTRKHLSEGELPPFPCGSCRQVLLEMEQRYDRDIKIYVIGSNDSVCVIETVKDLLPFAFSKTSL